MEEQSLKENKKIFFKDRRIKKYIFRFYFFVFIFLFILFDIPKVVSQSGSVSGDVGDYGYPGIFWPKFNQESCFERKDVILSIVPGGCSPNVIRSDLLEEQNVPVFCKLMSFQVNPLIDISRVRSISFKGQYPKGISGISYFPSRAALRKRPSFDKSIVGSPVNTDLGYMVVVVSRFPNEKEMPDFVEANITAVIQYDSEGVWGVGRTSFYLSEMSDDEWRSNYRDYGFWNGKAYIRADSIENDRATISIYRDIDSKEAMVSLKEGETSRDIYLGGYYCAAGLNLKLESIDAPLDSALLQINDEQVWVSKGDKIIDEKCTVTSLEAVGAGGKITINCPVKDGKLELSLVPGKAILRISESVVSEFSVNELLKENVYLAYIGQDVNGKRYAVLVKDGISSGSLDFADKKINSAIEEVVSNRKLSFKDLEDEIKKVVKNQYKKKLPNISQKEIDEKIFVEVVPEGKEGFGIFLEEVSIAKDKQWIFENLPKNDVLAYKYYQKAVKSYEDLYNFYPAERRVSDEDPYAAIGLYEAAKLSKEFGMNKKAQEYYEKIMNDYPDSNIARRVVYENDLIRKYDVSNAMGSVVINNQKYSIYLINFKRPKKEDRNAVLLIDGKQETLELNEVRTIKTGDVVKNIMLKEIKKDSVSIKYEKIYNGKTDSKNIRLGLEKENQIVLDGIEIKLLKINLKKQAKVIVIPKAFGPTSTSNFNFRVGIEKRAIKLTPEQVKDMMNNLVETINKINEINKKLGKVITVMKSACFASAAVLNIKNALSGFDGSAIARNKIMTGIGGWNEYCEKAVNEKQFSSVEECLFKKSSEIDRDVKIYGDNIKKTNDEIKKIQSEVKDRKKVEEIFKNKFDEFCKSAEGEVVLSDKEGTKVPFQGPNGICHWENLTHEQRRDIYTLYNTRNSGSEVLRNFANKELGKVVLDAKIIEEYNSEITKADEEAKKHNLGITRTNPVGDSITHGDIKIITISDGNHPIYKNFKEGDAVVRIFIPNKKTFGNIVFVANPEVGGKEVLVQLKMVSGERGVYFPEGKVYSLDGKEITGEALKSVRDYMSLSGMDKIKQGDKKAYQNPMKDPQKLYVKYFETAPYKGLPSEVPFDINEGWYVESVYVLSGFGRPYDESGRPINFYICNVGPNGLIEFKKGADDICRYYNVETGADINFPGLSAADSRRLVQRAEQAILDAARQYGKEKVVINGKSFKTGKSFGGEGGKCTDFMSPQDCQILFNLCDPVICPPSRCDLGGRYRVDNVIQTGVIGSLLLCLPNYREGIAIPICLTGVHAGLEGYASILNSTVQCLNESITTGREVGICDEIKSIYICDFFWKQAAPFVSTFVPSIFESLYGYGRGGGEYSSITSAWENTRNSINWFKNEYAVNSMQAFYGRTTADIGTEVCKAFVSTTFPASKSFFERLVEPDSPVQFHAWFSEDPLTTATIPPASHYKVYYHIYAGKDYGAYYYVYLKDYLSTQSFGQVLSSGYYNVDRGYVPVGSQVDQARDFIAPSGFKQICININGKDECGFGRVSTSYLINSFTDSYVKEQVQQRITTSQECVAGTASIYNFINPNLQFGLESALNPEIYKAGIIRVCASENPGKQVLPSGAYDKSGTSYDRWVDVGYCDDPTIRCWLDTNSVKNVIRDKGIKEDVLSSVNTSILEEDNFWSYEQSVNIANSAEEEIDSLVINKDDDENVIEGKINVTVAKLVNLSNLGSTNVNRARAHFLLGRLYKKISLSLLSVKVKGGESAVSIGAGEGAGGESSVGVSSVKEDKQSKVNLDDFEKINREEGVILKIKIFDGNEMKEYYAYSFDEANQEIILDNGVRKKIQKDNEGRIVFVEDGSNVGAGVGVSEIILEFQDGRLEKNVYYKFGGKWFYSLDYGKSWKSEDFLDDKNLDERNLNFIKNYLQGKSCDEGLKNLVSRMLKNEEGGFLSSSLVIHYKGKNKVFAFTKKEDVKCENLIKLFQ